MTDLVADLMGEALACLAAAVADLDDPPEQVCLRPGDQVSLLASLNDDECCTGLAWVRLVNTYPSTEFPDQDVTFSRCPPPQWAVVLEMGIARCAPTADATDIPSCEEWTAATAAQLADRAAMIRAVCCLEQVDTDRMVLRGLYTPQAVEGGCLSGTLQVTVAVPACECEESQ